MYRLQDGTEWTDEIKNAFKRRTTRAYLLYNEQYEEDEQETIEINPDNYLMEVEYKDEKIDPQDGKFIGKATTRQIEIKLNNKDNLLNLENKDLEYHLGAKVGDDYKYINFGNFIVQKPENQDVNEETKFVALDYMCKFDIPYNPKIEYPATLLEIIDDVCDQCGMELGNRDFRNHDKIIEANPFLNGEHCREVIKSAAKVSFTCAYVWQDNKLYFGFDIKENIEENITTDNYFELNPNEVINPINMLTLRSGEVNASGQTIIDSDLINEYGESELIVDEDYFAFTDSLRQEFLQEAQELYGLTYQPIGIDLEGSVYLSFNDLIEITNLKSETIITYAFNNSHKYNGVLYNRVDVPALTASEENYEYQPEDKTGRSKTAIEIDKANKRISELVQEINDNSERLSKTEITVDGIIDTVVLKNELSEIVTELKRDISGVSVNWSENGGNNLIYYASEFWNEDEELEDVIEEYTDTEIQNHSVALRGYKLNNGHYEQTIPNVINGTYTVSFNYKKLKELSNGTITINNETHELTNMDWDKYEEVVDITTNFITVEFDCDTDEAFYITDVLVNVGDSAAIWTQNPNETRTSNVSIGKGIKIKDTNYDTIFKANADGTRIVEANNESNVITEFTDKGTTTNNLVVKETSEISGLLYQKITYNGDEQTWISKL